MSLGDRVMSALKSVMVLDERTGALGKQIDALQGKVDTVLRDHEKRLSRVEAIIEVVRPDGGVMRITPPKA